MSEELSCSFFGGKGGPAIYLIQHSEGFCPTDVIKVELQNGGIDSNL